MTRLHLLDIVVALGVNKVGKGGTGGFKAVRIHVCKVVARDVHTHLIADNACGGGEKSYPAHLSIIPFRKGVIFS